MQLSRFEVPDVNWLLVVFYVGIFNKSNLTFAYVLTIAI